ncbi:hypothetical protein AB1N83_010596 [Pleurotus pulmonarius]
MVETVCRIVVADLDHEVKTRLYRTLVDRWTPRLIGQQRKRPLVTEESYQSPLLSSFECWPIYSTPHGSYQSLFPEDIIAGTSPIGQYRKSAPSMYSQASVSQASGADSAHRSDSEDVVHLLRFKLSSRCVQIAPVIC